MARKIECPACGNIGEITVADDHAVTPRGRFRRLDLIRCVECGAGLWMNAFSGLVSGTPKLIPDDLWSRFQTRWTREFGPDDTDLVLHGDHPWLSRETLRQMATSGRDTTYLELDSMLAVNNAHPPELDPGARNAIQRFGARQAKHFGNLFPTVAASANGTFTSRFTGWALNGFEIGRRLVGTDSAALRYSLDDTEAIEIGDSLIAFSEELEPRRLFEIAGPRVESYVNDCASQLALTMLGASEDVHGQAAMIICVTMAGGLALAVAEYEMFSHSARPADPQSIRHVR